jgi:hypothetical protein
MNEYRNCSGIGIANSSYIRRESLNITDIAHVNEYERLFRMCLVPLSVGKTRASKMVECFTKSLTRYSLSQRVLKLTI